ncbi:hypothetical protein [Pedobacter heparinus]|nr:hypothetical protein [Pedobacter heparinus]
MLLFTSIGHFVLKKGMENMVPERIPFKPHIVIATGIFEILAGFALLAPTYYKAAGWFLIAFFVLILPANVNASIHHINYQNPEIPGPGLKYLWFRIPLQILFVAWIYFTAIKT